MYAIIRTGSKEYKVAAGDIIEVEKLEGEVGSKVELPDVLLTGDKGKVSVGTPLVKGVKVTAEVLDQKKAPKVTVFKFKRRKNYIRTKGHRQQITMLKILSIGGAKAKAKVVETEKAEKPKAAEKTEKPKTETKKTTKTAKKPAAETKKKTTKAADKPKAETKKKTTKKTVKPKAEAKKTKTTKKPASETKKKTETKKKKSTE